jgi:hypothetical protein
MDRGQQGPGRFQLAVDERGIEDQLCPFVTDLRLPPNFDLALHGFEVSLDSVQAYRERIGEAELLGVLG